MTLETSAGLAVAAGAITGGIAGYVRRSSRGSVIALALFGALLAALVYAMFLAAAFVLSLLTWSGGVPDPGPALLGVLAVCAGFLLIALPATELGSRFGLPPRPPGSRHRDVEAILDARPIGGSATMWLAGVGVALLPIYYGVRCLVTQYAEVGSHLWRWRTPLEGPAAIAFGIGWIGVGAFLHFHFFFGLHPRLAVHSRAGKRAAVIVACAGFSIATLALLGGEWS